MNFESKNLQKVRLDAAAEIAVLDGTNNNPFKSVMSALPNQPASLSTSVAEIAKLYEIPIEDALEKVIHSGCQRFWLFNEHYGVKGLCRFVSILSESDIGRIEIELTPADHQRLDQALIEERLHFVRSLKPPRQFTPSDAQAPFLSFQRKLGS